MKIQIGGLSEGIHQYTFVVAASELNAGDQFGGDVHVDATLDKSSTQILLTARIETLASFECDRCLSPFQKKLVSSYTMLYVAEGIDTGHLDPAELQVVPNGMHIIDLREDVRQNMILALPFKNICNETCKGLCPTCGVNLNETSCNCSEPESDFRWEALRKLQSN
jgi:uncharacterized protein